MAQDVLQRGQLIVSSTSFTKRMVLTPYSLRRWRACSITGNRHSSQVGFAYQHGGEGDGRCEASLWTWSGWRCTAKLRIAGEGGLAGAGRTPEDDSDGNHRLANSRSASMARRHELHPQRCLPGPRMCSAQLRCASRCTCRGCDAFAERCAYGRRGGLRLSYGRWR